MPRPNLEKNMTCAAYKVPVKGFIQSEKSSYKHAVMFAPSIYFGLKRAAEERDVSIASMVRICVKRSGLVE